MAARLPSMQSTQALQTWPVQLATRLMQDTGEGNEGFQHALAFIAGRCQAAQAYLMLLNEAGEAVDVIIPHDAGGTGTQQVWERVLGSGWVDAIRYEPGPILFLDGLGIGAPVAYRGQLLGILLMMHTHDSFQQSDMPNVEAAASIIGGALHAARVRAKQQEAARHAVQLQRDMTAMAVHDLRVPLQSIRTTFAAIGRITDDSKAAKVIGLGLQATEELNSTIEGLLDIDRLESGRVQLQARATALETLVEGAFETLLPIATTSEHTLIADLPPNMPTVYVDRALVRRVIVNLVENAIKYTPPGGAIRVVAEVQERWVRVSICDSGPGVPRHLRGAIFDKYYRLREHVHYQGVGLGLAFCRLAVEAHGGQIEVDSDSSGARFSFTIPVEQRDADDTAPLVDLWME